jgi:ascorbate-specific PTS system EIIC-type component UlaA
MAGGGRAVTMPLAASAASLATAPAVLVTLVATLLLLVLRAWTQITHLALTRHVHLLLDSTIGVLAALFLVLVVARFVAVG